MRIARLLSLMWGGLLVAAGCDGPNRPFWKVGNFRWAETPGEYDAHVESAYAPLQNRYVVVARWQGSGYASFVHQYMVLCLKVSETSCGLDAGVVVLTSAPGSSRTGGRIAALRQLRPEYLCVERLGETIRLKYAGHVDGESRSEDGTGLQWLGFDISPRLRRKTVLEVYDRLCPALEEEPLAEALLQCMKGL